MKKITPTAIKEAIIEEALKIKRKKELYESVLTINKELKQLNEVGMVGSFGFKSANDVSNKTKTGFEADFQNISHIADLEREMQVTTTIKEEVIDEMQKLKEEIETLRQENENLKNK